MKIISWNCQGAFRKKVKFLLEMQPDIVVIQECEPLEKLSFEKDHLVPKAMLWFGDGRKGIGIFSYTDYVFTLHPSYTPAIRHCIPLVVRGVQNFNLLAVWAMSHEVPKLRYVGQCHLAVDAYTEFLAEDRTIMLGDFNSNSIWDNGGPKIKTHSELVQRLNENDLISIYHELNHENQGEEEQNTFFLYRHEDRGYHIDYCFIPRHWLPHVSSFHIGDFKTWSQYSDHCPLIIEFSKG